MRYSELESRWVGQTAKHVASVFRAAERQDAVLFFDEADAIAGRRFTGMQAAVEREANSVVNVLLHELETFPGVVIFATNLAANMDPAFERRIRTHIMFEMPDVDARERIWQVQLHPRKTPLAEDVDFRALAEAYPRSGGDIKNAVLKAAQIATTEPGPDAGKRIHQRHFVQGMDEVITGTSVMGQSLFDEGATARPQVRWRRCRRGRRRSAPSSRSWASGWTSSSAARPAPCSESRSARPPRRPRQGPRSRLRLGARGCSGWWLVGRWWSRLRRWSWRCSGAEAARSALSALHHSLCHLLRHRRSSPLPSSRAQRGIYYPGFDDRRVGPSLRSG